MSYFLSQLHASDEYGRIIGLSLILILLLIVGLVVVIRVKRRIQQPDEPGSMGFTLSDLRQLHKNGQMSDEEFERARTKVVEAAKRAAERQEAQRNQQNERREAQKRQWPDPRA